jgi:hypothetical protein
MKVVMTLATAALLATVGAAGAGEPMVLTDAQLDQVTAAARGGGIWNDNDIQLNHSTLVVEQSIRIEFDEGFATLTVDGTVDAAGTTYHWNVFTWDHTAAR